MFIDICCFWVVFFESLGGLAAEVIASDLGLVAEPNNDYVADFVRYILGVFLGTTYAQTRGLYADTQFFSVKSLGRTSPATLYYVNSQFGHFL